ncbi:21 kDa protein-like [Mercurialis annua]|uniref:21 kDa protein-like n=1 Tax=Mercurialis annua TaxID=3986 RepID=UPI00215E2CC9|nr:21 kDa protein-like [Mercurialis annua]
MASISSKYVSTLLLILLSICLHINCSSAARDLAETTSTEFIRTSCSATTYPKLCYSSLLTHASKIQTSPMLLANAALSVTLASATSTSTMMQKLSQSHGMKPREVSAMQDCMEELSNSVDQISRSIDELGNGKVTNFKLMINDVQTWASAALTDENTCSEGFEGNPMNGKLKTLVREQIVNIAHMTSNALALVNKYASLHS